MDCREFQEKAHKTAEYPTILLVTKMTKDIKKLIEAGLLVDVSFIYSSLGISGEAGEVVEKVKKVVRNDLGRMSYEKKEQIIKEIGDCFWYLAELCTFMKVDMEDVMEYNIHKLRDRQQRDVICNEGDNR